MSSPLVQYILVSDASDNSEDESKEPTEEQATPSNKQHSLTSTKTRHSKRLVDPQYKSFACNVCQQSFNYKVELHRHKASHFDQPKAKLPTAKDRWKIRSKMRRVKKKDPRNASNSSKKPEKIRLDDPSLLTPLKQGWQRLAVHRRSDPKMCDIYYKDPAGRSFRSLKEMAKVKFKDGLSLDHFTFQRSPLNSTHPNEIVRNAKSTSLPIRSKKAPETPAPSKSVASKTRSLKSTETAETRSSTNKQPKKVPSPVPRNPSKGSRLQKDTPDEKFLLPLNKGWTRLVVHRSNNKGCDVYYLNSKGQKFRSLTQLKNQKLEKGILLEYFSFRRGPLNLKHPKEIIKRAGSKKRLHTKSPPTKKKSDRLCAESPKTTSSKSRTSKPLIFSESPTRASRKSPKASLSNTNGVTNGQSDQKKRRPSILKGKPVGDQRYLTPLNKGWSRLVVYRKKNQNICDVYYLNSSGKKFRSVKELESEFGRNRSNGLSIDDFNFVRRALDVDHPKQLITKPSANLRRNTKETPSLPLRPISDLTQKRSPRKLPKTGSKLQRSDPKLNFLSQLELDMKVLQPRILLQDVMAKSTERKSITAVPQEPSKECHNHSPDLVAETQSDSLHNEDDVMETSEEVGHALALCQLEYDEPSGMQIDGDVGIRGDKAGGDEHEVPLGEAETNEELRSEAQTDDVDEHEAPLGEAESNEELHPEAQTDEVPAGEAESNAELRSEAKIVCKPDLEAEAKTEVNVANDNQPIAGDSLWLPYLAMSSGPHSVPVTVNNDLLST